MAFLSLPGELLPSSWTKLHISAYQNDVLTLAMMLAEPGASCEVDKEDAHKRTALHVALQHGRKEAASLLIENGAALEKAVAKGNEFITSSVLYDFGVFLLSRETTRASLARYESFLITAACNACMQGEFPLLQAVVSVSLSCLQGRDIIGLSPVHYAVMGGHMDCLDFLLSNGVDPDILSPVYKSTPLHFACRMGHSAIAMFLLESSSAPEVALTRQSANGSTPLHLALSHYHWDTVSDILNSQHGRCLVDSHDAVLDKCGYSVASLLQHLRCDLGIVPSAYQLLIPCLSQEEATRLLFSSVHDNAPHIVSYAIEQGAKAGHVDSLLQVTPLVLAARMGLVEIVRILLDSGANFYYADTSGRTALHYAAREGYHEVVISLLDAAISSSPSTAATLVACSKDGVTPLELAVMSQQVQTVIALLDSELRSVFKDNWLKLLYLAVGWIDRQLLQQLSLVFPSNWADLMTSSNTSVTIAPSSNRRRRKAKIGKPFSLRAPVESYYPLHLALTLGNMEVAWFMLSQCSDRQKVLEWRDSHDRSVASLLGGTDYSNEPSWEDEIMAVMANDFILPDVITFEWAALQHVITVHCLMQSSPLDRHTPSDTTPLQQWPDWYIERQLKDLLGISCDLHSERDQLMLVEEILTRFDVPLNKDMLSFASPMWSAVVGGANVAMVSLLMKHGGSLFVSRCDSHSGKSETSSLLMKHVSSLFVSRCDSHSDKSETDSQEGDGSVSAVVFSLPSHVYQYPALALAVRTNHSSVADYLSFIEQQDNLVFPTDEDTVGVFLSYLPTLLSKGHYSFVRWFLESRKFYLDTLVLGRHGLRLLFLSCFADCEEGTHLAQLLIDGYVGLVCRLLSHSEDVDKMQYLLFTLYTLNLILGAGPSLLLVGAVQSLALLFKVFIKHCHTLSLPSLFCFLCGWGYIDMVRLLLDHNAQLLHTVRDSYQRSPLYYAAVGGHLELVKLLLAKGAGGGTPPAILGALVYLAVNNPKRTSVPTRAFYHLPNYYLYKGDWTLRSEQLAVFHDHNLVPEDGVFFSDTSQHNDQSKALIGVLLDSTSEDVLKPASLYLTLMALVHDLSIVEPFITRFLQYLIATLDSTPPPVSNDYLMSLVLPASLHPTPELLTSVVAPMVALTPLKHPAVAAQKGYWTILSAMFTPELKEQSESWKLSATREEVRVISSEELAHIQFVRSCLVTLSYAIKAQEEAIATKVLQLLTSSDLGIEYLASLPSKSINCENIIFLCCKYRSLNTLQQLLAVQQMEDKVTNAVDIAVRVGNLEVLQWLDMSWQTIIRNNYCSLVLLAGSRGRLEIVEWLCNILSEVLVRSTDLERIVLFWATVLQGAAQGGHENIGLCALRQLSLSDMSQLANHPAFLRAVYWCCCRGLVRLLDAMCVPDTALFFKAVYSTTPFHCAMVNGMVGKLSAGLEVFPKIASSTSLISLASRPALSALKWNNHLENSSFFIDCLSIGWLKYLLDEATAECEDDSSSCLLPVVTWIFKQVGPRVNIFLRSVAIGNESVVQAFLSVWGTNAGCILHYLQTELSCAVLQLACNHPSVLEMLMKALFSADLVADSISVAVLEACIKSNKLKSLQLLVQASPSNLMMLEESKSKRNALHFAAENGVSQEMAEYIVAQLGSHSLEYCCKSNSHDLSPLLTSAYLGHRHLVSLFCRELGIERGRQASLAPLPNRMNSFKFPVFKNDFMSEERLLHLGWFTELMASNEKELNNLPPTIQLYSTVASLRELRTVTNFKALAARRLYSSIPVFTVGLQSKSRPLSEYLCQASFYLHEGHSDEFIELLQKLKSDGYPTDEICKPNFLVACTLGKEKVVEFMLKNGFVSEHFYDYDLDYGERDKFTVQSTLNAVGFGQLEIVCLLLKHFPQNIEILKLLLIDDVEISEQYYEEDEEDMEEIYAYLPQLVKMILFYSWGDIVRHFAQHSWRYGYIVKYISQPAGKSSRLLLADIWLTHKFGKHQIEYLHRLREEEWTVDCIPVVLDNGDNIDLKIDWNSFRRSIPSSDLQCIAKVPIGFHAYVLSSVLGQLAPFSKSASLALTDLFPSCSTVHTLSVSCVQSPSQPHSQLDGHSATLVVSYSSVTREFSFPLVPDDDPPTTEPACSVQPLYTISVSELLLMQSNQMRRWAISRRCPAKVEFSADFFHLTFQSVSCVLSCVAMVIKDIESVLDLASKPVALYSESGLIPCWFRNLYQTLAVWLTPAKLFNAVHVELILGNSEQVSVELVQEEQRKVIYFIVTLAHHEDCSPPSHTAILRKLSQCLLEAETELLTSQTHQFFSAMWAHQTGTSSPVDVLLENKDGVVTPLQHVTADHVFLLKLCPLFTKAMSNLVKQQQCLVKHSNQQPTPVYTSLQVVLSSASKSTHVDRSTHLPSIVLSLWELLYDNMFHSPAQLLQFLFEAQGLSPQFFSHLPCAILCNIDPGQSPDALALPEHNLNSLHLRNILNEPISVSQHKRFVKIKYSRRLYRRNELTDYLKPSDCKYVRVSATMCGHPIRGSPVNVQSVTFVSPVDKLTHEQANIPDPIVAIASHHSNQCCWWKRTPPSDLHYLKCMSAIKNCQWVVVKPLIDDLCDSNISLFVGFKREDASHKVISQSRLMATAFPMNCSVTLIKVFFDRIVPLKIAAFCSKCHNLLEVRWSGETTHLPRPCLFRPGTTPSPRYSSITATPPKRVTLFSNCYSRKVPSFNLTAGKQFQFYLIPRDDNGNLIDLMTARLETTLKLLVPYGGHHKHKVSPRSMASLQTSNERETVQCQMVRMAVNRQEILLCSCTLYHAGTRSLLFSVNEERSTTKARMEVCHQPDPTHFVLGVKDSSLTTLLLKKTTCPLLAYDSFYNPILQFNHSLVTATVTGPSGQSLPCEIKFCNKSRKVLISLTLDDPELSHLNVTVADQHIHGSPLPIIVMKAKPHLSVPFKDRFAELCSELKYKHEQELSPTVNIDRYSLLDSTLRSLHPEYFHRILRVRFKNEFGIDAGGVAREFFLLLTQEMVNPNYALFECVEDGRYRPNPNSAINPEHLVYFEFFGKIIGKIISSKCSMTVRLTPAVYKILTGDDDEYDRLQNVLGDLMQENAALTRSLNHVLECSDQNQLDDLTAHYTAQLAEFGAVRTVELEEGGTERRVTLDNKRRYVHKMARFYLTGCIGTQLQSILKGVHHLIRPDQLAMFTASELEEILSGARTIDLNYIRQRVMYSGYTENSTEIIWLWTVLKKFTQDERRLFLQFCTGSGTLPCNDGQNWSLKITRTTTDSAHHLPHATTCFNILFLPTYSSAKQLESKLRTAIQMGQGFHTY